MASTCPDCLADHEYVHKGTTYYRWIGVQVQGLYDGTLYYLCPSCGAEFHRWPKGHPRRRAAAARIGDRPTLDSLG